MLNPYYEKELYHLRTLAAEFGKKNPALAPLLGSSSAVDADVERLLEGVAFLAGLVHQRLDDDFPEFVQSLAQLLFPQFLQPLPCMTIMQYSPRTPGAETIDIPAKTTFASVDINDQRTVFRSVFPVHVEPLSIESVSWDNPKHTGEARSLFIDLAFNGLEAENWQGDALRFCLNGSYNTTSRLYRLLMNHTQAIYVGSPGQGQVALPLSNLVPFGFTSRHPLLPWPSGAHPAWRVLYEYFAMPEKFLFIELKGLSRWASRQGNSLRICFQFNKLPEWAPDISAENFVLNATPAVNLYSLDSQPIDITNRQPEYRVRPANNRYRSSQIFSIDGVVARNPDGSETPYQPFSAFLSGVPAYHMRLRPSSLSGENEHFLSLPAFSANDNNDKTLSVQLTCTDGNRADSLRLGDIREPTDNSPTRVTFSNIMGITPYRPAYTQDDLLWRVLSHLNANHNALSNADNLRKLLALYLPEKQGESRHHAAGMRQIESIKHLTVHHERRIMRGMPVEGSVVHIECEGDHFPGPGSVYLFGSVLNAYLAASATINTFVALSLHDTVNGDNLQWPAQIGQYQLL